MATNYTSLLGLALPVTGELSGTWGDAVNDYITKYVDAAVAGAQTISGSQTAVTLSTTTGGTLTSAGAGATGSAQYAIINCTGNPASLLTVTAPATSKAYIVVNATSTSQSVKIVGAGPTAGVTLVSGEKSIVVWNGSDFVKVSSSTAGDVTAAGNNAFTGANTFYNATGQTFAPAATNDGIIVQGRAGGSASYRVTFTPTTLTASRTATFPDADTTIPVASQVITFNGITAARTYTLPDSASTLAALGVAQTFTAAQTFRAASAVRSEAASTQDAVVLAGRAGGTSSFASTITPTTLTASRTVTLPDATGTVALLGTAQTFTAVQTLTDPAIIGTITEDVYTIVDGVAFEVDPANGSIQLITLGASRTPKATNFLAGEAITLMVNDGTAFTLTWTDATWGGSGVVWMTGGGTAPTLNTTGYTTIVLWKVSTQVYGAKVG